MARQNNCLARPFNNGNIPALMRRVFPPLLALGLAFAVPFAHGETESKPLADITAGLKLVDEIDPAKVQPEYESVPGASRVEKILGRNARVMPPAEQARVMAYVIGKGKSLTPGKAYFLTVEYPDDVPRTIFLGNRGADYVRGWATGTAFGDLRSQFTEPSVESLSYPQTGQWAAFKQYFHLLDRFQGVKASRNADPGMRPYGPEDGFHVVIFQSKQKNDPRSEGAVAGKIRLYEVEDPSKLYAPINYPPEGLPRRRILCREEMSDEAIQGLGKDRGVAESVDWYLGKIKMAKILGINTFTKDLLEFGHNQGWESGNPDWVVEAQPPNRDLWTRLVPAVSAEGVEIVPYYEYKGSIGMPEDSFARQKRAQKLYHGKKGERYTGVYFAEDHNADLTDPDTLADAKQVLDRTVVQFRGQAKFPGIWLRTRNTHLPISFSDAAIQRFKSDNPGVDASQEALIASYEGNKDLYNKYLDWWFGKRAQFLTALRDYLREQLGQKEVQVIFTPEVSESVPVLHQEGQIDGHPGVVTDDVAWWKTYANSMSDSWWQWHLMPTDFNTAVENNWYGRCLKDQSPAYVNGDENYHSAPGGDPLRYKKIEDVQMSYPMGRLFTVSNPASMEDYQADTGLTAVQFFSLNEESEVPNSTPTPFDHLLGYICVDCDRAGPYMMLVQARAVANAAPRNIAYLSGSSFSTGFPEIMRRFNQAFLAVPALPSKQIEGAASNPEVVVREISTPKNGIYYYVVNTSMQKLSDIAVKFPARGTPVNLATGLKAADKFDMDPAELLAFHIGP